MSYGYNANQQNLPQVPIPQTIQQQTAFSEVEFINDYLAQRYPRYCQDERHKVVTLKDFTDLQLPGRWLVTMSGHITAVINGDCYDTFDPSNRYIWCAYCVKE